MNLLHTNAADKIWYCAIFICASPIYLAELTANVTVVCFLYLFASAHVAHSEQWNMPSYCVFLWAFLFIYSIYLYVYKDIRYIYVYVLFGMGNENCLVFTTLTKTFSGMMCCFVARRGRCCLMVIDNIPVHHVLICEAIYRYCASSSWTLSTWNCN